MMWMSAAKKTVTADRYEDSRESVCLAADTLKYAARSERVALLQIAGFNPFAEPVHALRGAAVGETFGHDIALGAFLQCIIADLCGGVQAFFNIAWFENLALPVGEARPDAG